MLSGSVVCGSVVYGSVLYASVPFPAIQPLLERAEAEDPLRS